MADARMKIIIEALNLASKELKEVQGDLKGVDTKAEEADKGMQGLATALKAAGIAALALKAGKMAYELGLLGAQALRTEQGFETISGGAGNAAANLDAMMIATDGAIDRTTAMAMANQMMMMGIADTSDALAKNAEMATRLGRAMGVDAIPAMQNWNAMMANQSLPRLDTYGISSGKVRARINELMEATKGLTREQAFNTAVMEQGQIALDRLGDSVNDNMLAVEQAQAAYADLKTEVGTAFAGAVGNANTVVGKFTRQLGDNLRIFRENRDEMGLFTANAHMLSDALGAGETIFDEYRNKAQWAADSTNNWNAAVEYYNILADEQSQITIDLGENVGDSAAAFDDYSRALIASDGAANRAAGAEAELARQTIAAKDAALDAQAATLNFAAALGEMSEQQFAIQQIETITQKMRDLGATEEEVIAVKRELLIEFGLLTEAEEAATTKMGNLTQSFLDGVIDAEALVLALMHTKEAMDDIPSEKTIRIRWDVAPPPAMLNVGTGLVTGGGGPQMNAAGGVSRGGLTLVGEQGPELVNLPGGSHVYNNQVTNNFNNTINTRATAGTYMQDIAMARSMMSR